MIAKIKKYALLLVAVAAFAAPVAWKMYEWTPAPFTPVEASEIIGPKTAEVGEMVRLSAKADQIAWKCLPEIPDTHTTEDGLLVSFRRPGNYTFIAAIYDGGELKITSHTISVGGVAPSTPVVPTPNPTVPAPSGLSQNVKGWSSGADKATAAKLAANFGVVATEIQAGKITTPDEIIRRTAELNASLNLKGFDTCMGEIQAYLTTESDSGRLVTPEQHQQVWTAISEGLRSYATS